MISGSCGLVASRARPSYNGRMPALNQRAYELCNAMAADAERLGIAVSMLPCGTRLIDCGVKAPGSMEAGRRLAEVCISGLGSVRMIEIDSAYLPRKRVEVSPNPTVAACLASQYAGWEITSDGFFAMGSGPMRAAAGREELFNTIGHRERPDVCVGVLETSNFPPDDVCIDIAAKCGIKPAGLTLLVARTASPAGMVQIVARSVETALHKLHTLKFDLGRIEYGFGNAPLPPAPKDDLTAIGRTNDAILYGAFVAILVHGDDASLAEIGPHTPSSASPDFGRPFTEIFEHYGRDFYRIDPAIFSPAAITFYNCDTGNSFRYGHMAPEVLAQSFGSTS